MEELLSAFTAMLISLSSESIQAVLEAIFVGINHRLHFVWLGIAVVLATIIYFVRDRDRSFSRSKPLEILADTVRYCLPKSVLLHWSSLLDYKFYLVNAVLTHFITFTTLIVSVVVATDLYVILLQTTLGDGGATAATTTVRVIYTIAAILSLDFALWLAHYITHKVPVLWEFHKIHHAAAVLNPVTAYRIHPVEKIAQGICMGAIVGLVNAVFIYAADGDVRAFTIWSTSIATIGSNFYANLRHSHVWLDFGQVIGRIISSPAQHFIHHSTAEDHLDKNFAIIFSAWDWMFGTLVIPKEKLTLNLGLVNDEHLEYSSVWRLYALPFVKAKQVLLGKPQEETPPVGRV